MYFGPASECNVLSNANVDDCRKIRTHIFLYVFFLLFGVVLREHLIDAKMPPRWRGGSLLFPATESRN